MRYASGDVNFFAKSFGIPMKKVILYHETLNPSGMVTSNGRSVHIVGVPWLLFRW